MDFTGTLSGVYAGCTVLVMGMHGVGDPSVIKWTVWGFGVAGVPHMAEQERDEHHVWKFEKLKPAHREQAGLGIGLSHFP